MKFLLPLVLLASASYGANAYHLIKTIPLGAAPGGDEYFDYITVDAAARRVYLSHGTEFKVIDADRFTVLGAISVFKRNHGIALVPGLGKGVVSDGDAAQAVLVDLKSMKITSQVAADKGADSVLYDSATKHVFVFNGAAHNATVIDPATGSVVGTIALPGQPEQAVSDGRGMIYDNIENTSEVVAIDARTLQIKNRWPVAPAGEPVSIAMDRAHRRLYIGARNPKVLVTMDADTGKIIGPAFPIGDRVDANIFDAKTGIIAAATREGTLHIFHQDSPDQLIAVETVKTGFGAKTMGLDPKTHNLWLSTSDFDPPLPKTVKQPNPQPRAKPGTFRALVYGR